MSAAALLRKLDADDPAFEAAIRSLLVRRASRDEDLIASVAELVGEVRRRGDQALLEFTRAFDAPEVTELESLKVSKQACEAAYRSLAPDLKGVLDTAAERIRAFHEAITDGHKKVYVDVYGNRLVRESVPMSRVGIYVPGGQATYPSTLLMTAIPARVAGVEQVVVVSPPSASSSPDNEAMLLAAAHVADVDEFWRIGGVQAIAALAYGTNSIDRVDLIAGPGSARVTEAKRQVAGDVGIDLVAGPSEVLIVADEDAPADWLALDLCAQAEHDADAQAVLVTPSGDLIESVSRAIESRVGTLTRGNLIKASFQAHGALIRSRDIAQAIDIANRFAPEHLSLCVADPDRWLPRIRHAGAVFLGEASSEVFGDYLAGPSHVLPTSGSARFNSALGVDIFTKARSVISLTADGASGLADQAARFARAEGLEAHALAAQARRV